MKNSRTISQTIVGGALVVLFTIFNVGLPIALYVCPMISGSASACTCGCAPDTLAFTYESNCCCNASLMAERNTVPFIATEKYYSPEAASLYSTIGNAALETASQHSSLPLLRFDGFPPPQDIPLYLQSSALLI